MYVQSLLDEMTSPGPGNYNGPRRPYVTPSDSDRKIMNGGGGRPDDGKTDGDYADDINKDIYQNLKKSNARIEELRKKQIGEDTYSQYLKDSLKNTQARETNIDLSPLMALSDNWFGGNMAGSYNAGFTGDKKQAQILALQNALGKRQGQLSDAEQKSIADQIGKEYYGQQVMGGMIDSTQEKKPTIGDARRERKDILDNKYKYSRHPKHGDIMKGMTDIARSSKKISGILEVRGGRVPSINSPDYAVFQSNVSRMLTNYNKVAGLGALAGSDLDLLQKAIGLSPVAYESKLKEVINRGGMEAVLKDLNNTMDAQAKAVGADARDIYGGDADETFRIQLDDYKKARGIGGKRSPHTEETKKQIRDLKGKALLVKHSK